MEKITQFSLKEEDFQPAKKIGSGVFADVYLYMHGETKYPLKMFNEINFNEEDIL